MKVMVFRVKSLQDLLIKSPHCIDRFGTLFMIGELASENLIIMHVATSHTKAKFLKLENDMTISESDEALSDYVPIVEVANIMEYDNFKKAIYAEREF